MREPLFSMRLDAEDKALLDACSEREKLTKSDVLRRALRAYAMTIGVLPEPPPKPKPKKR